MENLNIKLVGLDIGNSVTKAYTIEDKEEKVVTFNTRIKNGYNKNSEEENRIHVVYDETDYTLNIGDPITFQNRHFSEQYKIFLLTALAKITNDYKNVFNITISVPAALYDDKEYIEKLSKKIKEIKNEKIIVDSVEKEITINECWIWAEGRVTLAIPELLFQKSVILADLGGKDYDVSHVENFKTINNFSYKFGIIDIFQEAYVDFVREHKLQLEEYKKDELLKKIIKCERFVNNLDTYDTKKYHNFIKANIRKLFTLISNDFKTEDKKIIFLGGGILALKDLMHELTEDYDFIIAPESSILNAKNNFLIAKQKTEI